MKAILSILILFLIVECKSNEIRCQLFIETTKSFEIYCERLDGELPADCYINFDIVWNPLDVLQLKVGGCDHDKLHNITKIYTKIHALEISHSRFTDLAWLPTVVEGFEQLQIINASHNEIQMLSPVFLTKVPELIEIDLSYNQISVIESDVFFFGARKLRKVNLSNNNILQIHSEAFNGSPDLEYIDLRENNLGAMHTFHRSEKLSVVHLEENQIVHFHCTLILARSESNPFSLYVSWTHVFEFDRYHTCKNQQLQVIVNNRLSSGVFITPNGLRELRCHEQSFDYLVEFYANHNVLKNVVEILPCIGSSIEVLDLSNNLIGELHPDAFERFIELKRLYLSGTMLVKFDANSFECLKNLRALDVSQNNLKAIENIDAFSKLETLEAAKNELKNVREIIEKSSKSLKFLDLSDSKMESLRSNTFDHLTQLNTLVLSNTNLAISDFNPFEPLNRLLALDISQNYLANVNFDYLSSTFNILMGLNVANCQISNVSDVIRQLSVSLEQLNLSGNNLAAFDVQKLEPFFNLKHLNLSNCNLLNFDTKFLRNLQELSELDLSQNKLHEIDLQWSPVRLEWLNLNSNELVEIYHFGMTIPEKLTFGISMNRLPCTYLMQLNNNFIGLHYIDDPMKQKHKQNCRLE